MSNTFFTKDGNLNFLQLERLARPETIHYRREYCTHCYNFLEPRFVLLHYTAGNTLDSTVNWMMSEESKVSYHFLIGRNGEITQLVSVNNVAWHAGESHWKGCFGLNKWSIGIGLCNWGPLYLDEKSGLFYPQATSKKNEPIPFSKIARFGRLKQSEPYDTFERYTPPQYFSLALLLWAITRFFRIEEILMHSQVSPGRKIDPGPAFQYHSVNAFFNLLQRIK